MIRNRRHRPTRAQKAKDEAELQKRCENTLTHARITYLHIDDRVYEVAHRYLPPGWPDLIFTLSRRRHVLCPRCSCNIAVEMEPWPCAVELKTDKGKLSADQENTLRAMRRNGWHVYVIRSYDVFINLISGITVEEWDG